MGHGHGRRELAERSDGRIDLAGYRSTPQAVTPARLLLLCAASGYALRGDRDHAFRLPGVTRRSTQTTVSRRRPRARSSEIATEPKRRSAGRAARPSRPRRCNPRGFATCDLIATIV